VGKLIAPLGRFGRAVRASGSWCSAGLEEDRTSDSNCRPCSGRRCRGGLKYSRVQWPPRTLDLVRPKTISFWDTNMPLATFSNDGELRRRQGSSPGGL